MELAQEAVGSCRCGGNDSRRFFLNINSVLTNVRAFPSEVRKTTNQFSSWYYDDAGWTGYWTSSPVGYVDQADMNLSQEPVGVYLKVENGSIDGMISNQKICDSIPFFDFVLLKGQIDTFGSSATVTAWDTIEGHDQNFAKLKLKIDNGIMTVEPVQGVTRLFPAARIAPDPSNTNWPSEYCEGKTAATVKMLQQIMERRKKPGQSGPSLPIGARR